MSSREVFLIFVIVSISAHLSHGRSSAELDNSQAINSGFKENTNSDKAGWLRKSLVMLGQVTSQLGVRTINSRVVSFVENFCRILKKIIPVVATVCRFKQFQFCKPPELPATTPTIDAINERNAELFSPF